MNLIKSQFHSILLQSGILCVCPWIKMRFSQCQIVNMQLNYSNMSPLLPSCHYYRVSGTLNKSVSVFGIKIRSNPPYTKLLAIYLLSSSTLAW